MTDLFSLVDLLAERHALSHEAYRALVEGQSPELAAYAAGPQIYHLPYETFAGYLSIHGLAMLGLAAAEK